MLLTIASLIVLRKHLISADYSILIHTEVRKDVVAFLKEMKDICVSANVQVSEFVDINWPQYLHKTTRAGEFGDHITLLSAARKIAVISSLGDSYNTCQ